MVIPSVHSCSFKIHVLFLQLYNIVHHSVSSYLTSDIKDTSCLVKKPQLKEIQITINKNRVSRRTFQTV